MHVQRADLITGGDRLNVRAPAVLGNAFFSPLTDALFICGGFSLPLLLWVSLAPRVEDGDVSARLALFAFANFAHFAASTVRLYTKPGTVSSHPFVAWGLPVVFLAAVTAALCWPDGVGRNLTALYLSWSPYHYAAQAYGLALIYCHRSSIMLSTGEKRALWWICMLPFIRVMVNLEDNSITQTMGVWGLGWLLPDTLRHSEALSQTLKAAVAMLAPAALAAPLVFAVWRRTRLPALALLLVYFNALWLTAFSHLDAATLVSVGHSIQYLCIVTYAHTSECARRARPHERSPAYQAVSFYALSVVAGFFLFIVLPPTLGVMAGLVGVTVDFPHWALMVAVAINLHHFIVDGYIWRTESRGPASGTPVLA